jgi:hypothetical protein
MKQTDADTVFWNLADLILNILFGNQGKCIFDDIVLPSVADPDRCQCRSGSRVLITKNWKKYI